MHAENAYHTLDWYGLGVHEAYTMAFVLVQRVMAYGHGIGEHSKQAQGQAGLHAGLSLTGGPLYCNTTPKGVHRVL